MDHGQNSPALPGTRRGRTKLYGLVGGAALVAALIFGAMAVFTNPNTTFAQTTTPSTTPNTPSSNNGQGQPPPFGERGGGHERGGGRDGQRGASGTISAISGNTLTLKQGDVIVIQATLNANTVYTKAGQTITLNDLKVGQKASVRVTTATDGSTTVSQVDVILDHAGGTISALDSSSLTLTRSNNTTVKVNLASSTTYSDLGKKISLSDLKTGTRVEVAGQLNSDGSLNAEVVNVQHDRLGGTVTAISGNTITVQAGGRGGFGDKGHGPGPGAGGPPPNNGNNPNPGSNVQPSTPTTTTRTINVTSSTTYQAGGQTIQLSDIAVGDRVEATGTLSSDGNSLSALQVAVQLPHYQGQVTSVNGSTIVIQDRGASRTIEVNSSTKYLNGQASASLSDVKVGANISAEGKVDSNGKMAASQVQLGRPQGGPGEKGGR